MTQEEKARFDALEDADIDYTDIPDMGDVDWQRPAPKPTVTMRLDEDVVRYFKAEDPKGYTRRLAAVLTAFARQKGLTRPPE
jgi:uncharacterized protein (DUF4415 family)